MSTVEQLLAGLIAQLEAQKSKTEGNPLPTFQDLQSLVAEKDAVCEDHEEFGNIGSPRRRKKNESASQAQQAFSVSVLYFFFFLLVVVRCTQSHDDQLSLMPSCVLGSHENYKWHVKSKSIKLSSLHWLCLIGSNFPNGFCSIVVSPSNSFAS